MFIVISHLRVAHNTWVGITLSLLLAILSTTAWASARTSDRDRQQLVYDPSSGLDKQSPRTKTSVAIDPTAKEYFTNLSAEQKAEVAFDLARHLTINTLLSNIQEIDSYAKEPQIIDLSGAANRFDQTVLEKYTPLLETTQQHPSLHEHVETLNQASATVTYNQEDKLLELASSLVHTVHTLVPIQGRHRGLDKDAKTKNAMAINHLIDRHRLLVQRHGDQFFTSSLYMRIATLLLNAYEKDYPGKHSWQINNGVDGYPGELLADLYERQLTARRHLKAVHERRQEVRQRHAEHITTPEDEEKIYKQEGRSSGIAIDQDAIDDTTEEIAYTQAEIHRRYQQWRDTYHKHRQEIIEQLIAEGSRFDLRDYLALLRDNIEQEIDRYATMNFDDHAAEVFTSDVMMASLKTHQPLLLGTINTNVSEYEKLKEDASFGRQIILLSCTGLGIVMSLHPGTRPFGAGLLASGTLYGGYELYLLDQKIEAVDKSFRTGLDNGQVSHEELQNLQREREFTAIIVIVDFAGFIGDAATLAKGSRLLTPKEPSAPKPKHPPAKPKTPEKTVTHKNPDTTLGDEIELEPGKIYSIEDEESATKILSMKIERINEDGSIRVHVLNNAGEDIDEIRNININQNTTIREGVSHQQLHFTKNDEHILITLHNGRTEEGYFQGFDNHGNIILSYQPKPTINQPLRSIPYHDTIDIEMTSPRVSVRQSTEGILDDLQKKAAESAVKEAQAFSKLSADEQLQPGGTYTIMFKKGKKSPRGKTVEHVTVYGGEPMTDDHIEVVYMDNVVYDRTRDISDIDDPASLHHFDPDDLADDSDIDSLERINLNDIDPQFTRHGLALRGYEVYGPNDLVAIRDTETGEITRIRILKYTFKGDIVGIKEGEETISIIERRHIDISFLRTADFVDFSELGRYSE